MARSSVSYFPFFSIFDLLLHSFLSLSPLFLLYSSNPTCFPGVRIQNSRMQIFPSLDSENFYERARLSGTSRLNLKSYASLLYVTFNYSEEMPQGLHENIGICLHRNASLGSFECRNDDWRSLQKDECKSVMSANNSRFIDVKSMDMPQGLHQNIGICLPRNASLGTFECPNYDWRSLQKDECKSVMLANDSRFIDVKSMDKISGSIMDYVEEGVSIQNSKIQLFPLLHVGNFFERVHLYGKSRLDLKSYASSLYVTVKAFEDMPQELHENIRICFHRNASLGICECGNDDWKSLQNGEWKSVISPYDSRFIDVKSMDKIFGSITIYVEEEFQQWRLFCLGIGFVMLLMAPIVSKWVPFYYSSLMALGVPLVILLILFQGMKLLQMGKKNILYLTLYGSVLGIGSYIAHYFSTLVNSILVSFGLNEHMHNPVFVFLLVGIFLSGAAFGYWIVRKFVLSKDGKIDVGIVQFVKWVMRIIAMVLILQSSLDPLLSLVVLGACWSVCQLFHYIDWTVNSCDIIDRPDELNPKHKKSVTRRGLLLFDPQDTDKKILKKRVRGFHLRIVFKVGGW